ncbi:MAG TPA: sterol desaturase family protein [Candidatus Dormibacteraeota bacterium]|nr:sterol desaturase family protein [Candidatus Dormibacteraeota bacterium]
MVPIALILFASLFFFILERLLPGRELPEAPGWYARAAFLNICQAGIVLLAGVAWNRWLQGWSLFHISRLMNPLLQGLLAWFVGTFVFYWWHRARHDVDFLWRVFHQVHHSPARIELLTAFYKHPVEIAADSILSSALLFSLLGASPLAGAWFNVFAVTGEYFYHSNLRTPSWLGYFLQRPEHHSIHHQMDLHDFNFGDITWWDRLFGTFREADDFAAECGFPDGHEAKLARMLAFHDEY